MSRIAYYFFRVVFAMRLRELRKARGISQVKLAMDLNMNQNSISRYESGAREADYHTLIAFADYFRVSIDYLLERTDDPTFHPGGRGGADSP